MRVKSGVEPFPLYPGKFAVFSVPDEGALSLTARGGGDLNDAGQDIDEMSQPSQARRQERNEE